MKTPPRTAFIVVGGGALLVILGLMNPLIGHRMLKWIISASEAGVLLAASIGWGRLILRGDHTPTTWRLLIGLGLLSTAVYTLAAFGVYHPLAGNVLIVAGLLCELAFLVRDKFASIRNPILPHPESWIALVALAIAIGTPIVFWDSCAYHLAIPEFILETGSLVSRPNYLYGFYSQATECLYTLLLPFPYGETGAQFLNALLMIAAALATAEGLNTRDKGRVLTLALCVPGLLILMFLVKNSSLLALSGAVAFEAATHIEKRKSKNENRKYQIEETPGTRGLRRSDATLAAGAALGIGIATHYAGLWPALFIIGLVALRSGFKAAMLVAAAAAPFALPLFIRNALVTGNPIYPFLGSVFGHESVTWMSVGMDQPEANPIATLMRLVDPWIRIEPLGAGSTLGIAMVAGLAASLMRRDLRRAHGLRIAVGLLIFIAGTLIHSRPRYGIGGILILLPAAAAGLALMPRAGRLLIGGYAVLGAFLVLFAGFMPLANLTSLDDNSYRARFDPAFPIAEFAAEQLPPGSRIASVGILRPYHWQGRLEYVDEYHRPDLALALTGADTTSVTAFLRARGYSHLAVDRREWARLRAQYHHLDLDAREQRLFGELLNTSQIVAVFGPVELYALPGPSPR